jgi:antibiotic biosynthesis monooxygenase (ABM) superfamily enzyme
MDAVQSLIATAVTTRVVLANASDPSAIDLLTKLAMDSAHFEGLLNAEITPSLDRAKGEWTVTQRFHNEKHAESWRNSPSRLELITQLSGFLSQAGHCEETSQDECSATVAACITSAIRPGMEKQYREWLSEIQTVQAQFPGYQGTYLQMPAPGSAGLWTIVLKFNSPETLEQWFRSAERLALIEKSKGLIASENIKRMHSAFPGWLPTDAEGQSPANWKAAMLVLLGLYPVVELQIHFLSPLLTRWHPSLGIFFSNVMSVLIISYVEMPILTKVFQDWLLPNPHVDKRRSNIVGITIILFLYLVENILFWTFR